MSITSVHNTTNQQNLSMHERISLKTKILRKQDDPAVIHSRNAKHGRNFSTQNPVSPATRGHFTSHQSGANVRRATELLGITTDLGSILSTRGGGSEHGDTLSAEENNGVVGGYNKVSSAGNKTHTLGFQVSTT